MLFWYLPVRVCGLVGVGLFCGCCACLVYLVGWFLLFGRFFVVVVFCLFDLCGGCWFWYVLIAVGLVVVFVVWLGGWVVCGGWLCFDCCCNYWCGCGCGCFWFKYCSCVGCFGLVVLVVCCFGCVLYVFYLVFICVYFGCWYGCFGWLFCFVCLGCWFGWGLMVLFFVLLCWLFILCACLLVVCLLCCVWCSLGFCCGSVVFGWVGLFSRGFVLFWFGFVWCCLDCLDCLDCFVCSWIICVFLVSSFVWCWLLVFV